MSTIRADALWTPEGLEHDRVIELDGARIVDIRRVRTGDPAALPGLVIPGLVNAHTHLEHSGRPTVPGGEGLPAWVRRVLGRGPGGDPDEGAAELVAWGTAAVSDISNAGHTAPIVARHHLQGVVQHELLTLDAQRLPEQLARVRAPERVDEVWVRSAPHAPYSTDPELIRACLADPGPPPGSIHLAEDEAELEVLADGTGPFADLLDELGIDWSGWEPPGVGPVAYLDGLGALGPGTLVVHGVWAEDLPRLAETETPVCLCPRSNLHIGGELPDVPAMLDAGIRICLGTDSRASAPDLDVLAEIPVLVDAFPEISAATWLHAATAGGADALGLPHLGRIEVGAAPGLQVLEEVFSPSGLRQQAPRRRWLVRPGRVSSTSGGAS